MRPFIAQLAGQYRQHGWVANTAEGLTVVIEGDPDLQKQFLIQLHCDSPALASLVSLKVCNQPLANFREFQIKASTVEGDNSAFVLPDIASCNQCIKDVFDPASRFYRYAFTSCSDCGPRYSIMTSQPYDRNRTGMASFGLCPDCERDYQSIDNRRFHAQTIACPNCGPGLILTDPAGKLLARNDSALTAAIPYLRAGKIIAVKGVGGYQLWVDAANQAAIERLRLKKHRPQKPFALMVANLSLALELCFIDEFEQQALVSSAAPIVLLKRKKSVPIAKAVAPDTNLLGVMLAYSPLHHLLLSDFDAPVIATSGNRQSEPVCIDNGQALKKLSGIADYFLMHDRPILRPLDDSIVRLIGGKPTVLRRARGYAPMPVIMKSALPDAMAVGGQLKNTVAVCRDRHLILSPHIGDLDCADSQRQFVDALSDLRQFYRIKPVRLMRDLHDGYSNSRLAEQERKSMEPVMIISKVQHHYAHILACMAEHGLEPPLLGIAWDGNGLGSDNSLWGGEFLLIHANGFERYAHFRPFSLPGGITAINEPRRSALGMLYEIYSDRLFDQKKLPFSGLELKFLQTALSKQINCPRTTSAGRLFDAVASLLGLCQVNQYQGQAAMRLENCAADIESGDSYSFTIAESEPLVIDWQATMEQLIEDISSRDAGLIANKFHNTLANIILAIAMRAGEQTIVLSGGCFQNARLVETACDQLKTASFNVFRHEKIPPNDGGLALGQLYAAKFTG